jgi:hypothetical protein
LLWRLSAGRLPHMSFGVPLVLGSQMNSKKASMGSVDA